jgi:hypothetical protein
LGDGAADQHPNNHVASSDRHVLRPRWPA